MSNANNGPGMDTAKSSDALLRQVIDIAVKVGILYLLLRWSWEILHPFFQTVVWGAILAVAISPFYKTIVHRVGERRSLAAVIVCFGMLLCILIPGWFLADSLLSGVSATQDAWESGHLEIPAPTEQVKEWPVIGQSAYDLWSSAAVNITDVVTPHLPTIRDAAQKLFSALAGFGFALVQFIFAIIVAGAMLVRSQHMRLGLESLATKIDRIHGITYLHLAETTVRNVAKGVLGVAFIQAVLAGIGFAVAGLPGAGLWAMLCLILGVIQVGVGPVMIGVTIYLFSTASTLTASLFLVWTIMVIPLDNILKPILLGKGAPVPMLVIFLGSLGGFLRSGIIGLFVGAIVVSLVYTLIAAWLKQPTEASA